MKYYGKSTFTFIAINRLRIFFIVFMAIGVHLNGKAQFVEYNKKSIDSLYSLANMATPEKHASILLEILEYKNLPKGKKIQLLDSALQIAKSTSNIDLLYKSHYLKSEAILYRKKYDSAFELLHQAKSFAKKPSQKTLADLTILEGQIMYKINKVDSAKLLIKQGLKLAAIIDDPLWLSEKYAKLGLFFYKLQDYKTAIEKFTKAIDYKKNIQTPYFRFTCNHNMSLCYSRFNKYEKSLETLFCALENIDTTSVKRGKI